MKRTIKRWQFLVWQALSKKKRSIGYCQRCHKQKDPRKLDGHHLIPKSKGNYAKFCEENIVVLCDYCHRRWWHGTSTWDEQKELIEQWIGLPLYWEIKRRANETTKYSEEDYKEMLEKYETRN